MAKNSVKDAVVAGLASSHPYAVIALCNACNCIPIDLTFIADHADGVIKACNVPYLSAAPLVGSIFQSASEDKQAPISLVNTDFPVDHAEVLLALTRVREKWMLGPLLDGHEYVAVVPATSVRHSRTARVEILKE